MHEQRGSRRLRATTVGLVLAAVAGGVGVSILDPSLPSGREWIAPVVFAVLHAVARRYPLPVPTRGQAAEISTTVMFGFGVLLTAPAAVAVALLCLGVLVPARDPVLTRGVRIAVDLSRAVLGYGAAAAALTGLSALPSPLPADPIIGELTWELAAVVLPAALVAGLIFGGSAILIRMSAGSSLREATQQELAGGDQLVELLMIAIAPALVVLSGYSILFAPLGLLLVVAMFRASRVAAIQRHAALHDGLTGLANRRNLDEHLSGWMRIDRRLDPFALLVMDLDGFKEVNEQLGHNLGDLLLAEVGNRLASAEHVDLAARVGGDEFAFVIRDTLDHERLLVIGEELVKAVSAPYVIDGIRLTVGASLGIAQFPFHATAPASLLRRADTAMYSAKRSGVQVGFASVDERPVGGAVTLVGRLEEAIKRDELQLDYQPQVSLQDGAVMGFEALLRWNHPDHGLILPDEFVPTVEHTDLIGALTRHVLRVALRDASVWHSAGYPIPVAVNISTRDLLDKHLPRDVASLLWDQGVSPQRLVLEITETALQVDPARSLQVLNELRELGVRLSVDDFGTGYSSLAALQNLPVDELKIDRAFVERMHESSGLAIVRSIVQLGHALDLRVVAEGVEDEETIRELHAHGCDHAQGYFVSRPLLPMWVLPWLASHAERPPGGVRQRLREVPIRPPRQRMVAGG